MLAYRNPQNSRCRYTSVSVSSRLYRISSCCRAANDDLIRKTIVQELRSGSNSDEICDNNGGIHRYLRLQSWPFSVSSQGYDRLKIEMKNDHSLALLRRGETVKLKPLKLSLIVFS